MSCAELYEAFFAAADDETRSQILTQIEAAKCRRRSHRILEGLQNYGEPLQIRVIQAMADLENRRAYENMVALMSESWLTPNVRAAMTLVIGCREACWAIVRAQLDHPDPMVRSASCEILGFLENLDDLPRLERLLTDEWIGLRGLLVQNFAQEAIHSIINAVWKGMTIRYVDTANRTLKSDEIDAFLTQVEHGSTLTMLGTILRFGSSQQQFRAAQSLYFDMGPVSDQRMLMRSLLRELPPGDVNQYLLDGYGWHGHFHATRSDLTFLIDLWNIREERKLPNDTLVYAILITARHLKLKEIDRDGIIGLLQEIKEKDIEVPTECLPALIHLVGGDRSWLPPTECPQWRLANETLGWWNEDE